ncbi:DUF1573 domain-containing protein [Bacteroidales bacterium OttesenSCG-928-E04]|nr:DUF1573 domain-containing protein [Bacteroidales bacterium OttesenSCG-928-E04]
MKKIVTFVIILACAISLSAQTDATQSQTSKEKTKTEKVKKEKSPKKVKVATLEVDKTLHDYGTIYKGSDGECEFTVKNVGKAPLTITNVRTSCGCTVPVWPKDPIEPKKTAVIKVKYNTNNVGTISRSVTVESNASNGKVQLKIKGNVINKPVEKAPENSNSSLVNPN